mgnify:CR=1 FL=1
MIGFLLSTLHPSCLLPDLLRLLFLLSGFAPGLSLGAFAVLLLFVVEGTIGAAGRVR